MIEEVLIKFQFQVNQRVQEVHGNRVGKVFSRSYWDDGEVKKVSYIIDWDNKESTVSCLECDLSEQTHD